MKCQANRGSKQMLGNHVKLPS
ncbi:hypothetical protein BC938DRAFT_481123 [Jimgerdemannia flammicorona]|uniref:Uncharacterized protein n=1 Tax=Jimgerdemannia flammicorona TaxID=994334 RepID=A0A433QX52_9FUNG|nr:hypothetical protein BC938DRAFT_481123 [Jimgerdemannia flammicorona]